MKRRDFDFWIFITVLLLLSLGVCMVYSASSYYAGREFGNKEYFLVRQLLWATIGVIAMLIVSRLDYKRLAQFSPILLLISIILLVLVRIPGIGSYRNGVYR